ncbi:MAG: hypothetical protein KAX20_05355 [Candidatus Omnitrophica bacterium]|nr:hypothetical protein [Candidatus Omnitrophota bacterium]
MKDKKYGLPEGETGAYGFVKGVDDNLYLGGPSDSGKIYFFDISTKKYEIRKWKEKWARAGLFMGNRYFCGTTEDNLQSFSFI